MIFCLLEASGPIISSLLYLRRVVPDEENGPVGKKRLLSPGSMSFHRFSLRVHDILLKGPLFV